MNSFQSLGGWLLVINVVAVIAGYVTIFLTTISEQQNKRSDAWAGGLVCTLAWTLVSVFISSLLYAEVIAKLFKM